jgi:signal transduction histidine kinase
MKLRTRLVLAIAYILLAVIVALTVPLAVNLADRSEAEVTTDTLLTAQTVAAYIGRENLNDEERVREILAGVGPAIERVVITDLTGEVIYDSTGEDVGQVFATDRRPEIVAALRGIPNAEVRYSETEGRNLLVAAAPIIDEGIVGSVRLSRDLSEVDAAKRRSVIGLIVIGAGAVLAGVLIAFGLAGSLSRPIRSLAGAAHALGGGELAARAGEVGGAAEFRELAASFDEMAARLERTVQAQREFVANASHQLRTPLTGMKLRLEGAIADAPSDEVRRQLQAAEREVDRLSEIVDRLLVMAREIEQGVPTRVDLGDAAHRAVERWHDRATQLDSQLSATGPGVTAQANPTDVDQILDNLLDNALAYAPGPVEIRTGSSDAHSWLSVRDHGAGIPEHERSRVTERFYRGRGTPAGGSGLGLAIARELAEKWGGELRLSDADGGGTQVEVSFRTAGT